MNAAVAMQNAVWLAIWPIKFLGLYDALVTYTGISITTFCNYRNTVHCLRQIPSFTGSVENRGWKALILVLETNHYRIAVTAEKAELGTSLEIFVMSSVMVISCYVPRIKIPLLPTITFTTAYCS